MEAMWEAVTIVQVRGAHRGNVSEKRKEHISKSSGLGTLHRNKDEQNKSLLKF